MKSIEPFLLISEPFYCILISYHFSLVYTEKNGLSEMGCHLGVAS